MSPPTKPSASPFTLAERAWLRQELGVHFGAGPQIADGLFLRSWKSGPEKGKPKLPPAARSMLDRGLIEIRPGRIGYSALFTEAGLTALRQLVLDARAMDPSRFGHLREQLGLQAPE
jgi:hypothetical protein